MNAQVGSRGEECEMMVEEANERWRWCCCRGTKDVRCSYGTYHCSKVSGSMTWDAVEFDGPALN